MLILLFVFKRTWSSFLRKQLCGETFQDEQQTLPVYIFFYFSDAIFFVGLKTFSNSIVFFCCQKTVQDNTLVVILFYIKHFAVFVGGTMPCRNI